MNEALSRTFQQIEQQRDELIKTLQALPAETYHHVPSTGQWSVSQVMAHLVTAERLSLAYMKKKALGIEQLPDSGLMESLRVGVLKLSQRLPLKFKAPKVVVENTPDNWPLETMIKQWSAVRDELKSFLESLGDKHARRVIYKHPVGGRLDARQGMIFIHEHVIHHMPQIRRLIKSSLK